MNDSEDHGQTFVIKEQPAENIYVFGTFSDNNTCTWYGVQRYNRNIRYKILGKRDIYSYISLYKVKIHLYFLDVLNTINQREKGLNKCMSPFQGPCADFQLCLCKSTNIVGNTNTSKQQKRIWYQTKKVLGKQRQVFICKYIYTKDLFVIHL